MNQPDTTSGAVFLAESRRNLIECQQKIRHCVEQLSDEQLWHRAGESFNSIANLVLHLDGNVRQRINSLIGGDLDQRDRDREFAQRDPIAKRALMAHFDETITRADAVLAALDPARLLETRRYRMLRGEVEGTLITLILQTLVHLGGHTQEIVALTRLQLRDGYRFLQTAAKPA